MIRKRRQRKCSGVARSSGLLFVSPSSACGGGAGWGGGARRMITRVFEHLHIFLNRKPSRGCQSRSGGSHVGATRGRFIDGAESDLIISDR